MCVSAALNATVVVRPTGDTIVHPAAEFYSDAVHPLHEAIKHGDLAAASGFIDRYGLNPIRQNSLVKVDLVILRVTSSAEC